MADDPPGNGKAGAAAAYLSRALAMNPLHEGDAIVALRNKVLRLKPKEESPSAAPDTAARRTRALATLDQIRGACWSDPPERLLDRLDQLRLADLPDVKVAADRLRVVASNRAKLPALAAHKHFDGDFFSCLKQVLAASPRETSVLREQMLASFRSGGLRKRGRRMVKLIEKQLPELYRLEADWFASLMRQKASPAADAGGATNDPIAESDSGGIPWWVWWIGFVLVSQVIRAAMRGGGGG